MGVALKTDGDAVLAAEWVRVQFWGGFWCWHLLWYFRNSPGRRRRETKRKEERCIAVLQASVGLQVLTE